MPKKIGVNMGKRNRKAMSTIIAALLIIILVLVSVGIVWGVVSNIIKEGSEQVSLGSLTLDLEIEKIEIQNDSAAIIKIKRNQGEGEFIGFKLIFNSEDESEIVEMPYFLKQLEEKSFLVYLEKLKFFQIKSVGISPLFELDSGKIVTGNVKDEFEVPNKTITPPGCTDTCSSLGYECGMQMVCGVNTNCGDCDDSDDCTSDTCSSGTCSHTPICIADGNCCESAGCAGDPDCSSAQYWENGIVAWWSFDSYNSTHILDNSSYNTDARFVGTGFGPSYLIPGIQGKALGFTLNGEYLDAGKPDQLNWENTNGEFSIGFWIRQENSGSFSDNVPLVQRGGTPTKGWKFYQGSASSNFYLFVYGYSGSSVGLSSPLPLNTWIYVVGTANSTHNCIYKNGLSEYDCNPKGSGSYSHPDSNFFIGTYYSGQNPNFYGSLDEIIVWNRALNTTEISDIYNYF